ncbi:hypothetical protein AKJ09_03234 [Labilithrix luteola]|uniref:Tryptophan synthase alpha chain n=1 Tax=Labilithrix luteola TaxID=1391654 RepID=A0A0K1PSQ2_9BACT|nr:hypothetical protein [Labilithrix luteola]AKU96570.1 hypothetical protein AKJ09_03234 [Labilithrix luteola]
MHTRSIVTSTTVLLLLLAWGCDSSDDRLGFEPAEQPAAFGAGDASPDADPDADASWGTKYCPTSACAFGYTTCASSRFLCDTNLLTDANNCGACGHACPKTTDEYSFACIGGECVMKCPEDPARLDCDGIVDNGCETWPTTNEHCGACNVTCDVSTDPTHACTNTTINYAVVIQCGCPNGLLFCNGYCVDPNADDHCGGCAVTCDPNGGPQPNPPKAHYGCVGQQCGKLKCETLYLDCDGNQANGCEVHGISDENCGACGIACGDGTHCIVNTDGFPQCMCEAGTSLCVTATDGHGLTQGYCADFGSDDRNCGGCGVECFHGAPIGLPLPGGLEACVHGSCELRCVEGNADCNDSPTDGCETNTFSDPRNCGGCGIQCDLAAGQACAGGHCMLAPCKTDEETAR